jgi:hypothetical protein
MLYLERIRATEKEFFEVSDVSDLYTIALLLANKYLYDEGEEDHVYNSEWAASSKKSLESINEAESKFLDHLDWNLSVKSDQFESMLAQMETKLAMKQSTSRVTGMTYSEMTVLLDWLLKYSPEFWDQLTSFFQFVKTTCLCLALLTTMTTGIGYAVENIEVGKLTIPSTLTTIKWDPWLITEQLRAFENTHLFSSFGNIPVDTDTLPVVTENWLWNESEIAEKPSFMVAEMNTTRRDFQQIPNSVLCIQNYLASAITVN